MKNITRIILSALIGLLSPLYCGAENLTPKNSQINTLSHASSQIITIQVGSFKKAEDAEQNLARLKGLGLDAFKDHERVKDKGMWHRVYIGRFESNAAATEYANELVDKGIISGFWVKKKNVPITVEKQPETDQNENQTPVADIQSPDKKILVTSNAIPAPIVLTESPEPSKTPEVQKSKETDISTAEDVQALPDVVTENTHPDPTNELEIGEREGRFSLGLKASALYATNADKFKVTSYSSVTDGESWTFVNGYGFVGLVGDFNVYEGLSFEASVEKDIMQDIDIWQFILGPRYEFRQLGLITPYARAGIIVGRLKWDVDLGSFDPGIGLDAGLGAVLIKSNFQFGLELSLRRLRYNYNKPTDELISVTEDYLDMSGIVFSGTISYLF